MTVAVLVAVVLACALAYAGACAVAPFSTCRLCAGQRERKNWLGQVRPCWYCRGQGRRLRVGRRVFNHFASLRRKGTKV